MLAGMPRGPKACDPSKIFRLADANNSELTKAIFEANHGDAVCSWGQARRRYNQHVASKAEAKPKPMARSKDTSKGATTQVVAIKTSHQAAVARGNKERRFEAYQEQHKADTLEAGE